MDDKKLKAKLRGRECRAKRFSMVKCQFCDETFSTLSLPDHLKRCKEQKDARTCTICFEFFKDLKKFKLHMTSHEGAVVHKCNKCGAIYKDARRFRWHCKQVTCSPSRGNGWKCKFCKVVGSSMRGFSQHMGVFHKGQGDFNCSFCDEKFPTKTALMRHARSQHKTEKEVLCHQCQHISASPKLHKKHLVDEHNNNNMNEEQQEQVSSESEEEVTAALAKIKLTGKNISAEYDVLYPRQSKADREEFNCYCGVVCGGLSAFALHKREHIMERKKELQTAREKYSSFD